MTQIPPVGEPKPIHVFRPYFRVEETLAEIKECLEKGWTGLGFKTVEFEDAWKNYTFLPHAHFVNSCTAALHLAFQVLKRKDGWKDGDEVISTPLTFVATNHAILKTGLEPVFADVDEYLCLDPASVESRITSKTRAVVFMGMGGNAGRLRDVADLCRKKHLRLVLDAAHMAGTRVNGRHVGNEADVSCFSFHAVKPLPTADSGMVCFMDPELDAEARKCSWFGISEDTFKRTQKGGSYRWRYNVDVVGDKYHGNSIIAAMGLVSLRHLDRDNAFRRQLAAWYDDLLHGFKWVSRVPTAPGCESARHLYQIMVDRRDELMVYLNSCGIYPGVHYKDNTAYPMYSKSIGRCSKAYAAGETIISLPMHLLLTRADLERIAKAIADFK